MDTQKVFDTVLAHARRQGKKCQITDEYGHKICVYRNGLGSACFVGALIKDENYYPELEGLSVKAWEVEEVVVASIGQEITGADMSLLDDLQFIHDNYKVAEWEEAFMETADKYKLHYTPLD
jgi:hypothetical protein